MRIGYCFRAIFFFPQQFFLELERVDALLRFQWVLIQFSHRKRPEPDQLRWIRGWLRYRDSKL